jgi:uncharacterized membrane protein YqhA
MLWAVIIHATFVTSCVLLAVMDWLSMGTANLISTGTKPPPSRDKHQP